MRKTRGPIKVVEFLIVEESKSECEMLVCVSLELVRETYVTVKVSACLQLPLLNIRRNLRH